MRPVEFIILVPDVNFEILHQIISTVDIFPDGGITHE